MTMIMADNKGNRYSIIAILCAFASGYSIGFLQGSSSMNWYDGIYYRRQLEEVVCSQREVAQQQHRANVATNNLMAIASWDSPPAATATRDVHVGSMCRCGSQSLPMPGGMSGPGLDTGVVQPPSLATGTRHAKRFVHHLPGEGDPRCACLEDHPFAEPTADIFLKDLHRRCPEKDLPARELAPARMDYNEMPDLAVEESLPLFIGVLSYKSPLSLNGTLHNWLHSDLFRRSNAQDVFVQLNKRSSMDDDILARFQETMASSNHRGARPQPPMTAMGTPDENLHPGLAISKMCRAAEAHPSSHPEGENLLLFLEKDWNLFKVEEHKHAHTANLEAIFRSINALSQRGVPFVRLMRITRQITAENGAVVWNCPSEGMPWTCTTSHHHRWTNTPLVVSCKWFLRYMEPYALLDDPIMYGCRPGFQEAQYCDWEEALQDGRVPWSESNWVVAHLEPMNPKKQGRTPRLFYHKEVDQ